MSKTHSAPYRTYRTGCTPASGETSFQIVIAETDLMIVADRDLSREAARIVRQLRGTLEAYISLHPDFATSLAPLAAAPNAPEIVRRMCRGAETAGVGPMAAVAGTISQLTAEGLAEFSRNVLVENGGDLYCISDRDRVVGLLPEPGESVTIGLNIPAGDFPTAICASSGRIGHSLSFGQGDLAVVRAKDASFADAAATALANMLQAPQDLGKAIEQAKAWSAAGLDGVFAQCGGQIAAWGKMELAVVS